MLVSNETVAPIFLQKTLETLSDYDVASVILPDGEEYKTLDILNIDLYQSSRTALYS